MALDGRVVLAELVAADVCEEALVVVAEEPGLVPAEVTDGCVVPVAGWVVPPRGVVVVAPDTAEVVADGLNVVVPVPMVVVVVVVVGVVEVVVPVGSGLIQF